MTIETLRTLNPGLNFITAEEDHFAPFGRTFKHPHMGAILEQADALITAGLEENQYIASVPELEALPGKELYDQIFGEISIQVGFVAGPNMSLNGLEYHKSPEVIIALTDQVLLLGKWEDIDADWQYDSSQVIGLYLKKGDAIELYPRTLHFSPCRVQDRGFKSLIILPRGTNTPLSETILEQRTPGTEAQCLFMKNKWLLAHPERKPLMQKGAYPGIRGKNIVVQYK
jgi:hypothetical protein